VAVVSGLGGPFTPIPKTALVSPEPDPQERTLTSEERLKVVEERRRAYEGILWQLPGVSLAAQAFLLAAGLNPDAKPETQYLVGGLGIVAVIGTGFVVLYQALRAAILGRWVEHHLGTSLAIENLAKEDIGLNWLQKLLVRFRNAFYVPWVLALGAFLLVDLYVFSQGSSPW
jgi:hypothetical protein